MNAPTTQEHQITLLPIDKLFPSPTNPRKRFNQEKLSELANSIKAIGIGQPLLVRAGLEDDGHGAYENKGRFEIIAGERRFRIYHRRPS